MINYVWKITAISTLPSPPAPIEDCAIEAKYSVTASSNDITVSIDGSIKFSIPEDGQLIPYADLTEKQVLEWIQSEPNLVTNIESNLNGQIDAILNPPIVPEITPLPWASK
jgi:hypothetical protein